MNKLVQSLARIISEKIQGSVRGRTTNSKMESRFIFHGPPMEILEPLFLRLAQNGGLEITLADGETALLPVLLQAPQGNGSGPNPGIGMSGKCDENHLLHIRNDPYSSSFLALVPPGQHNNRSFASTTDEFGISASSNT
jgi:hypothetical protein